MSPQFVLCFSMLLLALLLQTAANYEESLQNVITTLTSHKSVKQSKGFRPGHTKPLAELLHIPTFYFNIEYQRGLSYGELSDDDELFEDYFNGSHNEESKGQKFKVTRRGTSEEFSGEEPVTTVTEGYFISASKGNDAGNTKENLGEKFETADTREHFVNEETIEKENYWTKKKENIKENDELSAMESQEQSGDNSVDETEEDFNKTINDLTISTVNKVTILTDKYFGLQQLKADAFKKESEETLDSLTKHHQNILNAYTTDVHNYMLKIQVCTEKQKSMLENQQMIAGVLNEYTQKVTSTESNIADKETELENLTMRLSEMQRKLDETNNLMKLREQEKVILQTTIANSGKKLAITKQVSMHLENKHKHRQRKKETLGRIEKKEERMSFLKDEILQLEKRKERISELLNDIKILGETQSKNMKELSEKHQNVSTLEGDISKRKEEMASENSEIELKNIESSTMKYELKEKESNLLNLSTDLLSKEQEVLRINKEIEDKNEEALNMQTAINKLEADVEKKKVQIKEKNDELADELNKPEEGNAEVNDNEEEKRDDKVEVEDPTKIENQIREDLKTFNDELQQYTTERDGKKENLSEIKQKIAKMNDELTEIKEQKKRANTKHGEIETQLNDIRTHVEEMDEELKNKSAEQDRRDVNIQALDLTLKRLQTDFDAKNEEVEAKNEEVKEMNEEVKEMNKKVKEMNEELKAEYKEVKAENEDEDEDWKLEEKDDNSKTTGETSYMLDGISHLTNKEMQPIEENLDENSETWNETLKGNLEAVKENLEAVEENFKAFDQHFQAVLEEVMVMKQNIEGQILNSMLDTKSELEIKDSDGDWEKTVSNLDMEKQLMDLKTQKDEEITQMEYNQRKLEEDLLAMTNEIQRLIENQEDFYVEQQTIDQQLRNVKDVLDGLQDNLVGFKQRKEEESTKLKGVKAQCENEDFGIMDKEQGEVVKGMKNLAEGNWKTFLDAAQKELTNSIQSEYQEMIKKLEKEVSEEQTDLRLLLTDRWNDFVKKHKRETSDEEQMSKEADVNQWNVEKHNRETSDEEQMSKEADVNKWNEKKTTWDKNTSELEQMLNQFLLDEKEKWNRLRDILLGKHEEKMEHCNEQFTTQLTDLQVTWEKSYELDEKSDELDKKSIETDDGEERRLGSVTDEITEMIFPEGDIISCYSSRDGSRCIDVGDVDFPKHKCLTFIYLNSTVFIIRASEKTSFDLKPAAQFNALMPAGDSSDFNELYEFVSAMSYIGKNNLQTSPFVFHQDGKMFSIHIGKEVIIKVLNSVLSESIRLMEILKDDEVDGQYFLQTLTLLDKFATYASLQRGKGKRRIPLVCTDDKELCWSKSTRCLDVLPTSCSSVMLLEWSTSGTTTNIDISFAKGTDVQADHEIPDSFLKTIILVDKVLNLTHFVCTDWNALSKSPLTALLYYSSQIRTVTFKRYAYNVVVKPYDFSTSSTSSTPHTVKSGAETARLGGFTVIMAIVTYVYYIVTARM